MTTTEYLPYPALWEGLVASIKQQMSGTFLIATHDNASCRFALEAGRVTHCSYSRLHGEAALLAFTNIEAGRYSLNNMLYPFRTVASIAHERALEVLGIQASGLELPPHVSVAVLEVANDLSNVEQPKSRTRAVKGSQFTPEELEKLFGKFYFE
ncbi:MAG: hypothetical protein RI964_1676 [Pseudomonadota bacterium]|jgi:hypothetical protein